MRVEAIKTIVLTLLPLVFSCLVLCQPAPQVRVGLSPKSVEVEPGGSFKLRIVIYEGGSLVRAGEFNFSYETDALELLNVTPLNEWIVTRVKTGYIFYTLKATPNETTVAEFQFRYKQDKPTNITLSHFKAADAKGNDLEILAAPITVTVKAKPYAPSGTETSQPRITVTRERAIPIAWVIVLIVTISAALVAVVYLPKVRVAGAYSLIDRSGRVVFHTTARDRVYGREDFAGIIPPEKLAFITRRSSGGQFRIVRGSDGWYIIDAYSTNPTLVNGVPIKGRGYVKLNNGDSISLRGVFELFFYGR